MSISRPFLRTGLSALMLSCAPVALTGAHAQQQMADASDAITVSATRRPELVTEVPATVSVITDRDIEENFVQDIKDLVRYEPGVSVRTAPARFTAAGANTGRDGNAGFNIRGLEGNRVLIINDGIRVPDGFSFGGQSVGRGDYFDTDTLKSVEILRGPASALYGSDGIAGAVSFTTKDPYDYIKDGRSFAVQGTPSYTSADDTVSTNVVGAVGEGPWSAMVSFTRREGHELNNMGTNYARNTDRTAPNPQDILTNAVLSKVVYQPGDAHTLRGTYEYFDSEMNALVLTAVAKPPLAATSTLGLLARDTTRRSRYSLDYRYDGAAGDLIESAFLAGYYQNAKTRQFSNEDRNTSPDRLRINTFDNAVYGFTGQAETSFSSGFGEHIVIAGFDVSFSRQEGIRDGTVPPAGEVFPTRAFPNTDFTLAGFFIQDEISLLNGDLKLYPAVRLDHYSLDPRPDTLLPGAGVAGQSKTHVSPKFAAIYSIIPEVKIFANWAEGFKAPSPGQVNNAFANIVANYTSIPNPNLRPETSQTIEGGLRYVDDTFTLGGTAFVGQYKDFIDQVQVGGNFTPLNPALYQFVNQGSVLIKGLELKGAVDFGNGFDAIVAASYAHGNAKNAGVRRPLDTVDPVKIVAGLGYRNGNLWGARINVVHSAGKEADRVSTLACAPSCFLPGSFNIVDATAFWSINEHLTVRGGAFNLFDKKYFWWSDVRGLASTSTVIDGYSQPGRNYGISLTARL